MARLYANENFPAPAVETLRQLGHDILTTIEAGQAGQAIPDPVVLAFAREQQRALLTMNRKHFVRLHGTQPDHAGLIVCTFDPDTRALAQRIHAAVSSMGTLQGQLIRINRPVTRLENTVGQ